MEKAVVNTRNHHHHLTLSTCYTPGMELEGRETISLSLLIALQGS